MSVDWNLVKDPSHDKKEPVKIDWSKVGGSSDTPTPEPKKDDSILSGDNLKAAAEGFASSVIPSVASTAGMGAGGLVGGSMAGLPGAVVGGVGGAVTAGEVTQQIQNSLMPESWKKELEDTKIKSRTGLSPWIGYVE